MRLYTATRLRTAAASADEYSLLQQGHDFERSIISMHHHQHYCTTDLENRIREPEKACWGEASEQASKLAREMFRGQGGKKEGVSGRGQRGAGGRLAGGRWRKLGSYGPATYREGEVGGRKGAGRSKEIKNEGGNTEQGKRH